MLTYFIEMNRTKDTPRKLILTSENYLNTTGKEGVRSHNPKSIVSNSCSFNKHLPLHRVRREPDLNYINCAMKRFMAAQ